MQAAHNLHIRNPGAKAVPRQIVFTFLQLLQNSLSAYRSKRCHFYSTEHPAEH